MAVFDRQEPVVLRGATIFLPADAGLLTASGGFAGGVETIGLQASAGGEQAATTSFRNFP